MSVKYTAGVSTGVAFELGETRTVVVADEAVDPASGFKDDSVTYTATVKDNLGNSLPATFVVGLKLDGANLVVGQALSAGVYDQTTGVLTLGFIVPDVAAGSKTVKLSWAEQTI